MKIICIGRNYVEHISELNNERPDEPVLFIKPDTALLNREFPFVLPDFSDDIHYETEVVVKINKVGKYINPKFAHKYYDQVSLPWEKAKAFDNSALVGDFISKTELEDIFDTSFLLKKNEKIVQRASTAQMIWNIDQVIAEASKYFTLKTGDLIFTGTPAGVGRVVPGDVLEGELNGKEIFRLSIK
jgi:2-keto-4-pentenoate hydratase/2-oxohepta-3-ene-1,7-dioic acid hydratase in catechol pathway